MVGRFIMCEKCRGRGFVLHRTGYLKNVVGRFYRNRVARDFCFDCHGTGSVEFVYEGDPDV